VRAASDGLCRNIVTGRVRRAMRWAVGGGDTRAGTGAERECGMVSARFDRACLRRVS